VTISVHVSRDMLVSPLQHASLQWQIYLAICTVDIKFLDTTNTESISQDFSVVFSYACCCGLSENTYNRPPSAAFRGRMTNSSKKERGDGAAIFDARERGGFEDGELEAGEPE